MRIPGASQAIINLLKWAEKDEWDPYQRLVFADHFDFIVEQFDITELELTDILRETFDMVYGFVLEDFFTARFGEEGEINIVDDYLKRRGWREKVPARRYLEALRDSALSLYEVIDLDPGRSMTVRDLIRGDDPVTIEEKLGSQSAARWDRIAARIVIVNNKLHFTGAILPFPHDVAKELLSIFDGMMKRIKKTLLGEARKEGRPMNFDDRDLREMSLDAMTPSVFTQAWLIHALDRAFAPLPELRNTDGEEIVFSNVRFPIVGDAADAAAVLDGIETFERNMPDELSWTWHGPGTPSQRTLRDRNKGLILRTEDETGRTSLGSAEIAGDALVLSTNSRERAEKGRDLLASRLGTLVGSPLTSHQDLEKMLDEPPAPSDPEPVLPLDMAEHVIHSYLDDHYRRTLDDPVPMLNGKSPRQATKTKKGREQVVDWLKQLENSEYHRAASQGQEPYDSAWMWQELNIDDRF